MYRLSENFPSGTAPPKTDRPLFVRVADALRTDGIQLGGSLPSESALGDALQVGRPQIREALSALEALGVIRSRQGTRRVWMGFDIGRYSMRTVALLTPNDDVARDLLEVRHALETSLLPRAVQFLNDARQARLRSLSIEMVRVAQAGQSFSSLDQTFHRTLFEPLENSVLDGVLEAFWTVFDSTRPTHETVVEDPGIAAMHGFVLDAIEEGDVRRAVHELDAHFYGVSNRFPNMTFTTTEPQRR